MASTVTEGRCPGQEPTVKYSRRAKETGAFGVTLFRDVPTQLHDDSEHMGIEKTMARLENRFLWLGMARDVKDYSVNVKELVYVHITDAQRHQMENYDRAISSTHL
jgi:hypothetical protein